VHGVEWAAARPDIVTSRTARSYLIDGGVR
jgi:hypothetical protein